MGDKIYYGIKTGLDEAYLLDRSTRDALIRQDSHSAEIIKSVLMGKDLRRYEINFPDRYMIVAAIDIPVSGKILKHFAPFRAKLEQRSDKGKRWWELRTCEYYDKFEHPKIVFPDIAPECRFALDEENYYGTTTVNFLPTNDLYLLGLLNSRFSLFYFTETSAALEGVGSNYIRFKPMYVRSFPVYRPNLDDPADKKRHDDMVQMVEKMLALKPQYAAAEANFDDKRHWLKEEIEQLDASIDRLVYELYGLTEAEIALVEGR